MTRTEAMVVRKQVVVNAAITQAFAAFTERFGDFKPPEHNLLQAPIAETVFEPRVGGHIQIYDTVLTDPAGDADAGIAHIETQYNAALHGLPAGTEYLHVTLADDDVTSATTVDREPAQRHRRPARAHCHQHDPRTLASTPIAGRGPAARPRPALRPPTHTTSRGKPSRVANRRTTAQHHHLVRPGCVMGPAVIGARSL